MNKRVKDSGFTATKSRRGVMNTAGLQPQNWHRNCGLDCSLRTKTRRREPSQTHFTAEEAAHQLAQLIERVWAGETLTIEANGHEVELFPKSATRSATRSTTKTWPTHHLALPLQASWLASCPSQTTLGPFRHLSPKFGQKATYRATNRKARARVL